MNTIYQIGSLVLVWGFVIASAVWAWQALTTTETVEEYAVCSLCGACGCHNAACPNLAA
jgi:hypothetical protein